jgi:sulfofructose kinase
MKVMGIGTPCVDLIVRLSEIPKPGGASRLLEHSWQGGGKVSTALIALACLGTPSGMIGVVGGDRYGKFCLQDFADHGVDTAGIQVDEDGETPFSIVLSDKQTRERSFIYNPGHLSKLAEELIQPGLLADCRYLHLESTGPLEIKIAESIRASGGHIIFDADHYWPGIDQLIPLIDVFIGSEYYYQAVFAGADLADSMKSLQNRGPGLVVLTLGAQGCAVLDGDRFFQVPGFPVDVADTTGAGDVFHGAFIYGLVQGWDSEKTAVFANATAAIKCTQIGGRAGIPDRETVELFLQSGVIDHAESRYRAEHYKEAI